MSGIAAIGSSVLTREAWQCVVLEGDSPARARMVSSCKLLRNFCEVAWAEELRARHPDLAIEQPREWAYWRYVAQCNKKRGRCRSVWISHLPGIGELLASWTVVGLPDSILLVMQKGVSLEVWSVASQNRVWRGDFGADLVWSVVGRTLEVDAGEELQYHRLGEAGVEPGQSNWMGESLPV